ncbi:MAG: DUF2058 family protein [Pseudomonadota bacterium]|nr:DUF2058 family protein [Pseudomonadota bacterium]
MTDSLRNQLLGLGFKPAPKPERTPERTHDRKPDRSVDRRPEPGRRADGEQPRGRRPDHRGPRPVGAAPPQRKTGSSAAGARAAGPARTREDIDLAKAYAIRAQREKDERIRAEQARQDEARQRREARARLTELVKGHALNDPAAEIARHFPYGGKIKRIHVTEAQLKALNAGEMGVLQMDGRYLLVTAEMLAQAEQVFAPAVALKVDPGAPALDDPYADPRYQVPDDLVW